MHVQVHLSLCTRDTSGVHVSHSSSAGIKLKGSDAQTHKTQINGLRDRQGQQSGKVKELWCSALICFANWLPVFLRSSDSFCALKWCQYTRKCKRERKRNFFILIVLEVEQEENIFLFPYLLIVSPLKCLNLIFESLHTVHLLGYTLLVSRHTLILWISHLIC